jgi:hypothetical protein
MMYMMKSKQGTIEGEVDRTQVQDVRYVAGLYPLDTPTPPHPYPPTL